jgi:uncharacterized sporulation protein YeaH/YhbH (DUF444 family)
MNIIDRRLNPGGKSFANRQRFLRRARAQVRRAVREASSSRSIKEAGKGGEISIPAGGVHEPTLRRSSQGGVRDYVPRGRTRAAARARAPATAARARTSFASP